MTTVNEIEQLENYIPVLNSGFVGLVDYMGDDDSIEQAARVSYGKGTRKVSETRGLIRYLLRHKHTSPFEMVEFKFHCKMPIFVARQWVRHRTASINEYSGRYSIMSNEFYIPEGHNIQAQSKDNKQGRAGTLLIQDARAVQEIMESFFDESYQIYEMFLGDEEDGGAFSREGYGENEEEGFPGVAKELARTVLPVSNYTEWFWKVNLHNLFHFLKLRMDPHAQYEIRVYAEEMYKLIKPIVPLACEAFEDFSLNAENYSAQENQIISDWFRHEQFIEWVGQIGIEKVSLDYGISIRELKEFLHKMGFDPKDYS